MKDRVKIIYIVDDDASICRALSLLLATYGLKTIVFSSAETFFKGVSDYTFGCLILDLHLPGMDGWGTQKRLLKLGSTLKVIMISSDKNEDMNKRALKSGAIGFLPKPFLDKDLISLISQAFKSK